jgi:hypothetical protein
MKAIFIGTILLILVSGAVLGGPVEDKRETWEFECAWGPWTLSPFRSPVERESEAAIRSAFVQLIDSAYLDRIVSVDAVRADLDSSGTNLSLAAWHHLHPGTVSLGIRIGWADYRIPFRVSSRHEIGLFGFPLGELETHGDGTVRIRSVMVNMLARWNAVRNERYRLSVYGGAAVLPFTGNLDVDGSAVLRTPLGEIRAQARESFELDTLRAWDPRTPSLITAPVIGISGRALAWRRLGFLLDVGFAHGTAVSAGLFIVL